MAIDSLPPIDPVKSPEQKKEEERNREEAKEMADEVMKRTGMVLDENLDADFKGLELTEENLKKASEHAQLIINSGNNSPEINISEGQTDQEYKDDSNKERDEILAGFGVQPTEKSQDEVSLDKVSESILKELRDEKRIIPDPNKSRESFAVINTILNDANDNDLTKKNKIEAEALNVPDLSLQVYAAMLSGVLGSEKSLEEKVKLIDGENGNGGINAQFSFLEKKIELEGDESTQNNQMSLEIDRRLFNTVKSCIGSSRENNVENADETAKSLLYKAMSSAEEAFVKDGIQKHEKEIEDALPEISAIKFDPANAAIAFKEIKKIADLVASGEESRISEISDKALNVADASLQVYAAMVLKVLTTEKGSEKEKSAYIEQELKGKGGLNEQFAFLGEGVELDLDAHCEKLADVAIKCSDNSKKTIPNDDDWDCGRFIKEAIQVSNDIYDKKEQDVDEKKQDESSQDEPSKEEVIDKKGDEKKNVLSSLLSQLDKPTLKAAGKGIMALALCFVVPPPVGPILALGFLSVTQSKEKETKNLELQEKDNREEALEKLDKDLDAEILSEKKKNNLGLDDDNINLEEVAEPEKPIDNYNDLPPSNVGNVVDELTQEELEKLRLSKEKLKRSQRKLDEVELILSDDKTNQGENNLKPELEGGPEDLEETKKNVIPNLKGNEDSNVLQGVVDTLKQEASHSSNHEDENVRLPDKEPGKNEITP